MAAMRLLSMTEGIIPAIETAHALAGTIKLGIELGADATILVNLSGRGDKDMETAGKYFDILDTAVLTAEAAEELAMRAGSAGHNA
jgi:tryptophan synthase beta chain